MHGDIHDLDRFLMAQAPAYDLALAELLGGRKLTHWMWYIFPQMRGLGHSPMSQRYGIGSLGEAKAYLGHRVLGMRLRESTRAVLDCQETSLTAIFGSPDDRKFQSSMTLFDIAAGNDESLFDEALRKFCAGRRDGRTVELLAP